MITVRKKAFEKNGFSILNTKSKTKHRFIMFSICWSQKYKHIHIFSVKFNPSVFRNYGLTIKPSLMYDPNMLTVLENNQIYIFLCSAHKTRYKSIFSLSLCYVTQKSVIFNVLLTVKQKFTSFAFCTWNYVLIERNQ